MLDGDGFLNYVDELKAELTRLRACIATLSQLDGGAAKGPFLVEEFKARPFLVKYFRRQVEPIPANEAPLVIAQYVTDPGLPAGAREMLRAIVARKLELNVPAAVVVKAMARAGFETSEGFEPANELMFVIHNPQGGNAAGHLLCGGRRVMNCSWVVGPAMQAAIAKLRSLGVCFEGKPDG